MAAAEVTAAPAIEGVGLGKRFGPTVALDGVSFAVPAGQVHALLGENGAGKSTLVKLLSGLSRPDAGELKVFGQAVQIRGPRDAHRLGIRTAFQEIALVDDLTVAQNMLLPDEPVGPLGQVRRRRSEELVRDGLAALGLGAIDPRAEIRGLDLPTRQKIEIARAIFRKPRILLLDEPTSALSAKDVGWLGELLAGLRRDGVTVLFISHRMPEVRNFCSGLTILRNGRNVGSFATGEIDDARVIELVIGRSLAATFPPKPVEKPPAVPALQAQGALGFTLAGGEILGVAGLEGMGQRELFLSLFGMLPPAGPIAVAGREVELRSPADAVRAGISLVPEDRKAEALALAMTGCENVTLPVIGRFVRRGLIDRAAETAAAARVLAMVQVAARALYAPVRVFSGGNQQKIAIAKWLLTGGRILLMYDPTRGVDVGTKAEIYRLMRDFADAGGAILFYSTDIPELVNLCDRVLVVYRGRLAATLAGAQLTEGAIMRAALGERENAREAAA